MRAGWRKQRAMRHRSYVFCSALRSWKNLAERDRKVRSVMPFVPAPNIIMTEVRYVLAGQKIENRIMVDNGGSVEPADLSAVAIATWNWAETAYIGNLSDDLLLSAVVCTDLTASDAGQYTYAPDATTTGSEANATLPNECAFCVSLHTASRGRSARGRWFVPAIPLAFMVDANNVTAGFASSMVSSLQTLINELTTGTRLPVIVSYRHDNAPRVGGPVYYPIISAAASDTLIDSQKRRKPGVGS